jgi:hypothetical protein
MVENTNSTTLEVQGSFALTYMVGFIPLNLRSQEMDKGVPRARAPSPPPARPGVAWRAAAGAGAGAGRGVAWRGEAGRQAGRQAGVVFLDSPSEKCLTLGFWILLQLPSARG